MKSVLFFFLLSYTLACTADPDWSYDAGGMVAGNPVVHDGLVYVTGGTRLHAIDDKGKAAWTFDAGAPAFSTPLVTEHAVYLVADNGLHAVSLQGDNLWHFKTTDGPFEVAGDTLGWGNGRFTDPWAWYRSAPSPAGEVVVFGNRQGTFAVNVADGSQAWHAATGVTHTRPVIHDGLAIVGSWDNHLYGLDLADGGITWVFEARLPQGQMAGWLGWEGFNLDPCLHEGTVYAGSRGTYFYAVDAVSGIEKWSAKHPTSWIGSPAIVNDKVIYFGLSDGNALIGLETRMGNQSLLFRNRFYNFARPQANGDTVFLASLSGELYAVEKTTGRGRVVFATVSSRRNLADLQDPNGGLKYLYSKEGYTHENATRDVQRMLKELDSLLSLTLDGDALYAGSANGHVYRIGVP